MGVLERTVVSTLLMVLTFFLVSVLLWIAGVDRDSLRGLLTAIGVMVFVGWLSALLLPEIP
jgi:hypothetical protein